MPEETFAVQCPTVHVAHVLEPNDSETPMTKSLIRHMRNVH